MTERTWTATGLPVLGAGDFSGTRLERPGLAVVCFGATWCPPTRRFMAKFVAERGRMNGELMIADITDLESPLWDTFRIEITPTVVVFQDGEARQRVDGKRMIGITAAALAKLRDELGPRAPGARK